MEPLQNMAGSVLMIYFFLSKSLDNVGNKWQPVDSHGLPMGPKFIVSHLVENSFNIESSFLD